MGKAYVMGSISRTFDFRIKRPHVNGLKGGGHAWKDVKSPTGGGNSNLGNYADGDIHLGLGNTSDPATLQWRFRDGVEFRIERDPTSIGSNSVGLHLWCDAAIKTQLAQSDRATLALHFDDVEVEYRSPATLGDNFQCAVLVGARVSSPAGGTTFQPDATEVGSYDHCRTSLQFNRDAAVAYPRMRLNATIPSTASGTAVPFGVQYSDVVAGGAGPPAGVSSDFRTHPKGEFWLELQLDTAINPATNTDTESRLWQPGVTPIIGTWSRKRFVGPWGGPPAVSPLGVIDWLGGALAIVGGVVRLRARLLEMVVQVRQP
jgi:hypothetical protein